MLLRGPLSKLFSKLSLNAPPTARHLSSSTALRHRHNFTVNPKLNGDVVCEYKERDPIIGIDHLKQLQDSAKQHNIESEMISEQHRVALLFSASKTGRRQDLEQVVKNVVDVMPKINETRYKNR